MRAVWLLALGLQVGSKHLSGGGILLCIWLDACLDVDSWLTSWLWDARLGHLVDVDLFGFVSRDVSEEIIIVFAG